MVLKQQLTTKLSQKLVMTPSLQQAIKMLQLNKLEIETMIQKELAENAVLEEVDENNRSSSNSTESTEYDQTIDSISKEGKREEEKDPFEKIDIETFFADYLDTYPVKRRYSYEESTEFSTFENTLSKPQSLYDHLIWQLELCTDEEILKRIGRAIIGNLDKAGYLRASIDEIVDMDADFTPEKVREAVKLFRQFDPPGVAATDLKECLQIQMEYLGIDDEVCKALVSKYLRILQKRDYEKIEKELGIDREELKEKLEVIRHLDPKPGLKYNEERSIYIEPEVFVVKENGEYKVTINDEGLPKLRINPYYKKLAALKKDGDEGAVEYIKEKMKNAMWLLKSFDQRQKTIYKVTESIIRHQKDFFDYGEGHLKPMILYDIAQDVGLHESTISRVVNNKYMHTPSGVFELKYFFQRGITSETGDEISSITVKKKIKEIIEKEKPKKPLSDAKVAEILSKEGLTIARRTVAKYREEMNIPSSSKRKEPI